MDWIGLFHSEHWRDFIASNEYQARVKALEATLLSGRETDPHTLGKLRGQLLVFRDLPRLVERLAKEQQKREEEVRNLAPQAAGAEGLSLWHKVRNFSVR